MTPRQQKALILVDLQNDFLPGGALPVPEGDQVIPLANAVQRQFDLIVATQDWHPGNHGSFAANHPGRRVGETIDLAGLPQILWPVHCVQETKGAELAPDLDTTRIARIFQKGTDPTIDSYSGFYDNGHRRSTGLGEWLKDQGVNEVHILGLATDYCVRFTALDACRQSFETVLIEDACRGVNLQLGDVAKAIDEMRQAGVRISTSDGVPDGGHDVTRILSKIERGDSRASAELLTLVYHELHKLAAQKMAHEAPGHTLQPTALVHEAYLRLVDVQQAPHWNNRGHFFAAAAEAMRRILVENARRKHAVRRGGDRAKVDLDLIEPAAPRPSDDVLALSEALDRLEQKDRVKADLVKLRYFAGLTMEEAASALGISPATAHRYWNYARAWLHQEIAGRDVAAEKS